MKLDAATTNITSPTATITTTNSTTLNTSGTATVGNLVASTINSSGRITSYNLTESYLLESNGGNDARWFKLGRFTNINTSASNIKISIRNHYYYEANDIMGSPTTPSNVKQMVQHYCFCDIELSAMTKNITGFMNCTQNFATNSEFRVYRNNADNTSWDIYLYTREYSGTGRLEITSPKSNTNENVFTFKSYSM